MSKKNNNKIEKIDKWLEEWSDEECLAHFSRFFNRVDFAAEFVQDEDGYVTAQVLAIRCGDKFFLSETQPLDWPMLPAEFPDDIKESNPEKIN